MFIRLDGKDKDADHNSKEKVLQVFKKGDFSKPIFTSKPSKCEAV
jgi:hypothetical protein